MSGSRKTICQITSVHPRYDVRIFHKICLSLAVDYSVYLIVADGRGDEVLKNVTILDAGKQHSSRIKRMLFTTRSVYRKAKNLDCKVFHFHDPEFLFYGLKLSRNGNKVIYDVHEDVPKQTMSKDYLNPLIRRFVADIIRIIENYVSARLYAVITVTPYINKRFILTNKRSLILNNYPFLLDFEQIRVERREGLCYIGSISRIRGIKEIVKSLENIDITLNLAGEFESEEFKLELMSENNWHKVKYFGLVYISGGSGNSEKLTNRVGYIFA